MAMKLRAALRETLEGWQEDVAPHWRRLIDGVVLGFDEVDATLELEPWVLLSVENCPPLQFGVGP